MTSERANSQHESELTLAQAMSARYEDYFYGFTDDINEVPLLTDERLRRHFHDKDTSEARLAETRELILDSDESIQPSIALYVCGYPQNALDALSEEGFSAIEAYVDAKYPPKKDLVQKKLNAWLPRREEKLATHR